MYGGTFVPLRLLYTQPDSKSSWSPILLYKLVLVRSMSCC